MKTLSFWFDPISPYAYLSFEHLPQALEGCSYVVDYRPVLWGLTKRGDGETLDHGPMFRAGRGLEKRPGTSGEPGGATPSGWRENQRLRCVSQATSRACRRPPGCGSSTCCSGRSPKA